MNVNDRREYFGSSILFSSYLAISKCFSVMGVTIMIKSGKFKVALSCLHVTKPCRCLDKTCYTRICGLNKFSSVRRIAFFCKSKKWSNY